MADDSMALVDTLRKAMSEGDVDVLREGVRVLAQAIMEAEVSELTGLPKGERDPERRQTRRNGYRDRCWDTRVGAIDLDVPRVRDGGHFPSLLEPRRRAERALLAVIQEAYVSGVSTRRVDDLVRALGLELSPGNDEGSAWPRFIRSLVERGLHGVRLVISDDHPGLAKAVREQLLGSGWQRCRVHFTRNAQDLVPPSARSMVASAIRSVFEQPDERSARDQLDRVIDGMAGAYPKVAELLADAEADLLGHFAFPETHRSRIRSTNPLERLNKEIKRGPRSSASSPTAPASSASSG